MDAFEEVLKYMRPDLAAPLRGILMPTAWYPTELFVTAIGAARRLYGKEDFYELYGRAAAEYEIGVFFRLLARLTSPAYLLGRAGKVWRRFHDTGEWIMEGHGNEVRAVLADFGVVDAGYCQVLVGWIRRAGQLTGSKGGDVQHPQCRARGAKACLFTGWWT